MKDKINSNLPVYLSAGVFFVAMTVAVARVYVSTESHNSFAQRFTTRYQYMLNSIEKTKKHLREKANAYSSVDLYRSDKALSYLIQADKMSPQIESVVNPVTLGLALIADKSSVPRVVYYTDSQLDSIAWSYFGEISNLLSRADTTLTSNK